MLKAIVVDDEYPARKELRYILQLTQQVEVVGEFEDGEEALEPKNGNPYAALHTSKSLSEVDRLRLIIAKQEVEIARLKKGYWVEGVGANKEYVTGKGKTTKLSKK